MTPAPPHDSNVFSSAPIASRFLSNKSRSAFAGGFQPRCSIFDGRGPSTCGNHVRHEHDLLVIDLENLVINHCCTLNYRPE